jgi:hypothetical protein
MNRRLSTHFHSDLLATTVPLLIYNKCLVVAVDICQHSFLYSNIHFSLLVPFRASSGGIPSFHTLAAMIRLLSHLVCVGISFPGFAEWDFCAFVVVFDCPFDEIAVVEVSQV